MATPNFSSIYTEDYIKSRVEVNAGGCWEWQRSKDRWGYGTVSRVSSGQSLAHRLSYRIFTGDPTGLIIRHTCDNPSCCNPEHLMAGTQEENLKDMRQKGRDYTHEAVLASPEKLDMIKADLASTMPQYEIAEKYGISQSYLSTLKHTKLKEQNNGNT